MSTVQAETHPAVRIAKEALQHLRALQKFQTQSNPDMSTWNSSRNYLIPRYRSGELRISEQEARQIFISHLHNQPFLFSVETPTRLVYRFKDDNSAAKHHSALLDLTLYHRHSPESLVCNIEFKASTKDYDETKQEKHHHIQKDAIKLLCEEGDGIWVNITDSSKPTRMKDPINGTWQIFCNAIGWFIGDKKDQRKLSVRMNNKSESQVSIAKIKKNLESKRIYFLLCDLAGNDYEAVIGFKRRGKLISINKSIENIK